MATATPRDVAAKNRARILRERLGDLADDFDEDKRWGYPKWKVLLGKLTGKGRKCD